MHRRTFAGVAATAAAAFALTAGTTPAGAATGTTTDSGWTYTVNPITINTADTLAATPSLRTASECIAALGVSCHTVETERAAYDVPATINGEPAGTGSRIAIVVAYGSPTIQTDLDVFSENMGIPSTKVNVHYPNGTFDWSSDYNSWALETTLDVEWAHAMAPGATIDLEVAPAASNNLLNQAIKDGLKRKPTAISMSFASNETAQKNLDANNLQVQQSEKLFAKATAQGTTNLAGAGDWGSDNYSGTAGANYPASDPNVLAVGGTDEFGDTAPQYGGEITWDDVTTCPYGCRYGNMGVTGGAPSTLTGKPGNDISMNASVYTSVMVVHSYDHPGTYAISYAGGTSSSTPQWAGIVADLAQKAGHPLGNIRPKLADWAQQGALRDITLGGNQTEQDPVDFNAGPGWDIPTGYGVPDVAKLLALQ